MLNTISFIKKLTYIFLFISFIYVNADEVFEVIINTTGETQSFDFDSVEDLLIEFDNNNLEDNFPNYLEDQSAIRGEIDFRGLPMFVTSAENSTSIILSIPELDISERFNGNTREESLDALENYLEDNEKDILNEITKYLIENTALDPIAGNPNSLQSLMAESDFNIGATPALENTISDSELANKHSFDLGLRFGRFRADDKNTQSITLPLRYTLTSNLDPRRRIIFKLPITLADTEGSQAYNVTLGVGYRLPLSDRWAITPGISYGLVGSSDLGSAGSIYSASITNSYNFIHRENFALSMGNMLGYYSTIPIGDIDVDLQNWVVKNGIVATKKVNLANHDLNITTFLTDTRFFGDEIYVEQYNEIGFSVGSANKGSWKNRLNLGVTYLFSVERSDIDRIGLNLGYSF